VFGRFKAGKSSFLNHLTERAVLPIGVVPLTAVITRLRFGESERAEVHFLGGMVKSIPLGDIGLYVGENENPNNQKQVAAVEVELPELKALAPLQFVDTPGLGSAFAHNTEVALNWLPHVGAALVAVSSDREFNLEVREPSAPPVGVNYAFDAAFSTASWLIPLTLFRRPIERVLLRKARYEVEKNLSRLTVAWRDRVGVVIEELRQQTEVAAGNELDALARMVAQSTSDVSRLSEQIAELDTPLQPEAGITAAAATEVMRKNKP